MWPELDALLAAIGTEPLAVVHDGHTRRLAPRQAGEGADAPLPITTSETADALVVALAGWTETFALADDDDAAMHALDLVAAALFGRLRVHVTRRGDDVVAQRFVFATPRGPVVHRNERRWTWPWQSTRTVVLGNGLSAPVGHTLGDGGVLPWAPWAGTLAIDAMDGPANLAIDGELDLHPFSPREVKPLVLEYIAACKARGITELRIVHGKGIGALRRTVHALLETHPDVRGFRLGGHGEGGWGATIVDLHRARES